MSAGDYAAMGRLGKENYTAAVSPANELFKSIFQEMADRIIDNSPLMPVEAR